MGAAVPETATVTCPIAPRSFGSSERMLRVRGRTGRDRFPLDPLPPGFDKLSTITMVGS
jgi:hypothetical protein